MEDYSHSESDEISKLRHFLVSESGLQFYPMAVVQKSDSIYNNMPANIWTAPTKNIVKYIIHSHLLEIQNLIAPDFQMDVDKYMLCYKKEERTIKLSIDYEDFESFSSSSVIFVMLKEERQFWSIPINKETVPIHANNSTVAHRKEFISRLSTDFRNVFESSVFDRLEQGKSLIPSASSSRSSSPLPPGWIRTASGVYIP